MEKKNWTMFIEGDDDAFNAIYYEYVDVLYGYGMKLVNNRELVNDCIVSLFQYLYSKRKSISCPDNPTTYMLVSYKRLLLKTVKNMRSDSTQMLDDMKVDKYRFDMEIDIQSMLIENEQKEEKLRALQQALDELTPQQREVIYLKYYKKLNTNEIATVLGITNRSVYNVTQNAIKKLRTNIFLTKTALMLVLFGVNMI